MWFKVSVPDSEVYFWALMWTGSGHGPLSCPVWGGYSALHVADRGTGFSQAICSAPTAARFKVSRLDWCCFRMHLLEIKPWLEGSRREGTWLLCGVGGTARSTLVSAGGIALLSTGTAVLPRGPCLLHSGAQGWIPPQRPDFFPWYVFRLTFCLSVLGFFPPFSSR